MKFVWSIFLVFSSGLALAEYKFRQYDLLSDGIKQMTCTSNIASTLDTRWPTDVATKTQSFYDKFKFQISLVGDFDKVNCKVNYLGPNLKDNTKSEMKATATDLTRGICDIYLNVHFRHLKHDFRGKALSKVDKFWMSYPMQTSKKGPIRSKLFLSIDGKHARSEIFENGTFENKSTLTYKSIRGRKAIKYIKMHGKDLKRARTMISEITVNYKNSSTGPLIPKFITLKQYIKNRENKYLKNVFKFSNCKTEKTKKAAHL